MIKIIHSFILHYSPRPVFLYPHRFCTHQEKNLHGVPSRESNSSQRITTLATPHPNWSTSHFNCTTQHPNWVTPHPVHNYPDLQRWACSIETASTQTPKWVVTEVTNSHFILFMFKNILALAEMTSSGSRSENLRIRIDNRGSWSPHRWSAQWKKPPLSAEPRIELGPAIQ
jgi:hypothetical protein